MSMAQGKLNSVRRVTAILLAALCLGGGVSWGQSAKLDKQQKENSKQANKLWDKIRELNGEQNSVQEVIAKIDQQISAKNKQIDGIQTQLDEAETKRKQSEDEKIQLETKVSEHKLRLSERARTLYMQGELSYVDVMFNVADFGELVDRMFFVQTILEQDQQIVTDTKAAQVELQQKVTAIGFQIEEIEKIKLSLEEEKKNLERLSEDQRSVNLAIEQDKKVYLKEIRELEETNKRIMKELAAIASNKSASFSGEWKGSFKKPCSGTITSPYGYRIHPIYKTKRMHTGVDIGAPKGTAIRASGDGKVIVAKYYGGYGNTVIIDHGNNRTTLYGHMSKFSCKEGQEVKQGDKIGEVGSTGTSTGNHCHFEVRIKGEPIDPTKSM
ncbi:peptidoglycan DD-metalloendopeptidase family protein [bacterium]|nr:peptidoglycan DD-metalloendopeptidase family protein [bacterium]